MIFGCRVTQLVLVLRWVAMGLTGQVPTDDLIKVPGYPTEYKTRVFAGYLSTKSTKRQLHYVMVESAQGADNGDPLTLWLNGGPGCASKMGFLKQIGPYYLEQFRNYTSGDSLTPNNYSWHRSSNLLFIDSPAGTGFSTIIEPNYKFTDENACEDLFNALLNFFEQKFPEYVKKNFYVAGQSYAGKFIPDLVLRIKSHNLQQANTNINIKAILIGSGVTDFTDGSLNKSRIDFMISHNFIDPQLKSTWEFACSVDPDSASCVYFLKRYQDLLYRTDPTRIYGRCSNQSLPPASRTEESIIMDLTHRSSNIGSVNDRGTYCVYNEGFDNYFISNYDKFHSSKKQFTYCNSTFATNYEITMSGSMKQLPSVLADTNVRVEYFGGDWDAIVPYTDTIKNFERLGLKQTKLESWMIDGQNVGMKRTFAQSTNSIRYWQIKGGGHQTPIQRRKAAFVLFQAFLNNEQQG